jgi:hypothetical protein
MDVMWFTLPHRPGEDQAVLGRIADGQAMVMLYRGTYWQCALIIRLSLVEARRRFPTWATQTLQTTAQNAVIDPVLTMTGTPAVPWPVRLAQRWPILQRIPARVIGMGFRPEHVESPTA